MTKQEALRALRSADYIGDFFPNSTILLDGNFSMQELEAIIVLMKVCNEDGVKFDWRAAYQEEVAP